MLVITANTLRQQLTNTEGKEYGCDLHSKMAHHVKEKRQLFFFFFYFCLNHFIATIKTILVIVV